MEAFRYGFRMMWKGCPKYLNRIGMGKPGTFEGTYVGMLSHNGSTIAKALGGSVPIVAGVNDHDAPTP